MRSIGLVVLWLTGAGAAIGVASAGVNVVSSEVIEPAPAIRADQTALAPSAPDPESGTGPGGVIGSVPVDPAATGGGAGTDSGPGPETTTPDTSALPSTTVGSEAGTEILTVNLIGGSASIELSPDGAVLLWASAQPGFSWDVEPEGSGIKVEFRSEDHRSRLDAWWADGPRHDTREGD